MADTKKLYRSKTDRRIAGVCGGLGDYTGIDSNVWRIIFLLLLLPGGVPGFLVYILIWILVPEEGGKES
jgi:phage shock protein C